MLQGSNEFAAVSDCGEWFLEHDERYQRACLNHRPNVASGLIQAGRYQPFSISWANVVKVTLCEMAADICLLGESMR